MSRIGAVPQPAGCPSDQRRALPPTVPDGGIATDCPALASASSSDLHRRAGATPHRHLVGGEAHDPTGRHHRPDAVDRPAAGGEPGDRDRSGAVRSPRRTPTDRARRRRSHPRSRLRCDRVDLGARGRARQDLARVGDHVGDRTHTAARSARRDRPRSNIRPM